jgi:hypothetical protein
MVTFGGENALQPAHCLSHEYRRKVVARSHPQVFEAENLRYFW